ncbi:MAG: aspartate kinase [Prevotellaceae bacterium]|jgi:aspartate kinase|nr:aspartate kinase [Prevotellaceae bacterium]
MKVYKFGGTSVGSAERIKTLPKLIADDQPKIVVLSAMSGTTNFLVEIATLLYQNKSEEAATAIKNLEDKYAKVVRELFSKPEFAKEALRKLKENFDTLKSFQPTNFTAKEERVILAQGELMSTMLENLYLNETGVQSILLPALSFMRKDLNDEPDLYFIREVLKREIERHPTCKLFITQGYICRSYQGDIDNLKRGGSDYSASLIGAAINAEEVQIWTDIDGFHNNDPRIVEKTHSISKLSFDEASELAYFGAKILHPTCVIPVQEANIPLYIKNTMDPKAYGTRISSEADGVGIIKAVAAKDNITAVKIKSGRMLLAYGFIRKIFEVFEDYRTSIDMITTSEVAVSLTIDDTGNLQKIITELTNFGTVEVDKDMTIISVVGNRISENKGAAANIFGALSEIPIRMISFGGSRHNISLLIHSDYKKATLEALNRKLF